MPPPPPLARDEARLWRVPVLGGLDVLQARFVKQAFARHTHEEFTVGVVRRGAAAFWNRGAQHVAPDGSVMLINADEVNTGQPFAQGGYIHLVLYPSAELLRRVASEVGGRTARQPYFPQSVAQAPAVAQALLSAHRQLADPAATGLAQETALHAALAALTTQLSDGRLRPTFLGRERAAVQRTRAYLEAHACRDVTLGELASVGGLSAFHLSRVFREALGLPPHAYQIQARIRQAQGWLRAGLPAAQVALDAGFSDQSAFSNQFKRHVGVTPGQYMRERQDVRDFPRQPPE
ncbi:AraC family transcriptional regulator [Deinococcus saxicola]|uniref:AraC family transcriptional regulator n=1 Tax=Deinococcus saxicola TaxID=249406 RepID=UPI003D0AC191